MSPAMPPLPFSVIISLSAAHLSGTPHQGHPEEAVEAVRNEVQALPGACIVTVHWRDIHPAGIWSLLDKLEFVGCDLVDPETFGRIWTAVDDCVEAALQTLPAGAPKLCKQRRTSEANGGARGKATRTPR